MKKQPNSKFKKIIWTTVAIVTVLFIAMMIYVVQGLPSLEELENPKPQLASKVFSADGELLGQFFFENRIETDLGSVPQHLIDALIATEDRKFYSHWGVDVERFIKGLIKTVILGRPEGASTLTQQLSKNLYKFKGDRETFIDVGIRKIREWITSIQIEKTYTKREILELYLNVSYFGKSAFGVESAAKVYFDKSASELTIPEAAMLVALLKSSVYYDPERRYDNAFRRRNVVMFSMVDADYLDESLYQKFKEEPIILAKGKQVNLSSIAPHFMEFVRQQVVKIAEKHGYNLYQDGLNIYTSLDFRMQQIAVKATQEHLKEYQQLFEKTWKWDTKNNATLLKSLVLRAIKNSDRYKNAGSNTEKSFIVDELSNHIPFIDSVKKAATKVESGFVIIDPKTGQIKAMVGGEDQNIAHGLNRVTQIKRQPGSAFKPFVYAVALDNGYPPAYSLLNQKFDHEGWSPSNSDNEYSDFMTLREGLAKSVNVIAGRLTTSEIAPPSQVIRYAKSMGINSNLHAYPSIALGTFEVSPLELSTAYATLANYGVYTSPISILKVEDANGILLEEFKPEVREAIPKATAQLLINMMQDVMNYGTGAGARRYFHRPAAGKTGTTQDFSDAWFAGFTPQLAGGVWVGFDDHRIKFNGWYGQGARAAMPIWAKFMAEVYEELKIPLEYFELSDEIVQVEFCLDTILRGESKLATSGCPNTRTDYVISSKMPRACDIHSGELRYQGNTGSGW